MAAPATAFDSEAAPPPPGAKRRYPGVRSFEERDRNQFRGRNAAAEQLLLRVLSVRLLLQFAPSGVGKTSLLAAGLFPRLRPHDYFPCMVRLNQPGENLVDAVRRSLTHAATEFGLVDPVIPMQADSLWTLLAGTQLWSRDLLLLTPVLVFDQFEEIFELRDAAFRASFAQQMGELTGGIARPGADGEDGERGASPPPAKFVISLREEYLGKLEEFSARMPELFRERLRLAPLSTEEAREAIVEPAGLPGDDWASPPFAYTDEALALLTDFIDGASATVRVVEPLTLQLVCRRAETIAMERRTTKGGPVTLGVQDFGGAAGLERLVHDYYERVLIRIPPGARGRAQHMFEEGLLDPAGKRLMLEQGEIEREYRLDAATLNDLVASGLLRREPRNESIFYEISHDRLTDTIARHRKPRLPRWVWPTLATGALILAIVSVALWNQYRLTEEARAARYEAEYTLGQLLGETLVSRLRDAGLSDALRRILQLTGSGEIRDDYTVGLAGVLRWRHSGDIERSRGSLANARAHYLQALADVDALLSARRGKAQALLRAERARICAALGSAAADAGELTQAEKYFDASLADWHAAIEAAPSPRPQELLDAADSRNDHANLLSRIGDYDRSEEHALAASRLAARVWSTAYDGTHGSVFDANHEIGRAMQVFSKAAVTLANGRGDVGHADAALKLARESVRLRPLSFQARRQLGTAIAIRFMLSPPASSADWQVLLVEARRLFDDLGQTDADNMLMRRERAAVEVTIAEIVAVCIENPDCRAGVPVGEVEKSRIGAVESTGAFRWLVTADPGNRSYLSDVAWALGAQFRHMSIADDPHAAAALDEAIASAAKARVDPRDATMRWVHANYVLERAKRHAKAHRSAEVKAALDEAWAEFDGTPRDTAADRLGRIALLDASMPLLREVGLVADADALQARRDALESPGDGPSRQSYRRAIALNQEALELRRKMRARGTAEGRTDRLEVEQLHARAVNEYPYDAVLWSNLRVARDDVAGTGESEPVVDDSTRERMLRGAVAAAWMARVLQPDAKYLRHLYEARRTLAIHLRDRGNAGAEFVALADRGLTEAKELAREKPDATDTLFYLADANLGVALTHERGGWDEAFRVALAHGERLAEREPGNAERQLWLGLNRSYWATLLERDERKEQALAQRRLAVKACKAVEEHPKATTDQKDNAKACVKELAEAGIR
jgi:tetratricopeptide (TPR) repeat protein